MRDTDGDRRNIGPIFQKSVILKPNSVYWHFVILSQFL